MKHSKLFSVFSVFMMTPSIYASSCKSVLSERIKVNTEILGLLAPLQITNLVRNVDFSFNGAIDTLNPSTNVVVYSKDDAALLSDKNFPMDRLSERDRLVETDFGYAVLDVDDLRDWTLLQHTISDSKRAQAFINQVANTQGSFPAGITKEAADWLRWSVFAQYESNRKSEEAINKRKGHTFESPMDIAVELMKAKRAEFRRLVRQKDLFVFPFGQDARLGFNLMTDYDAQNVLKILARHYLLTNLYVRRPDGRYSKLSEFLDRDSLMLMSRFPALLPSYAVFESGHFSVDHMFTFIGRNDSYYIAEKTFPNRKIDGHDFTSLFIAGVRGGDLGESESAFNQEAYFLMSFENEEIAAEQIDHLAIDEAFSKEIEKMEAFLNQKTREFENITGYTMSVSAIVLDDGELTNRSFKVSFGEASIPHHVLTAFYIFTGLH